MNRRLRHVDYIRGVAVLLVLLQHCGVFPAIILAFHMPLFFFINGYIHATKDLPESFRVFALKRFDRLIVPYIAFEILNLALASVLHWCFPLMGFGEVYRISFLHAIRNMILCIDTKEYIGVLPLLWFFPCLFISEVLYFWVRRFLDRVEHKMNRIALGTAIVVILLLTSKAISYFLTTGNEIFAFNTLESRVRLPFVLDSAIVALAYVIIGSLLRTPIEYLLGKGVSTKAALFGVALFGLFLGVRCNDGLFLMFGNAYGNYFFATLGAISGIVVTFSIVNILEPYLPKLFLERIGNSSLVFFPVHLGVLSLYNKVCTSLNVTLGGNLEVAFRVLVALVVTMIIVSIVERYFKFLTGSVQVLSAYR